MKNEKRELMFPFFVSVAAVHGSHSILPQNCQRVQNGRFSFHRNEPHVPHWLTQIPFASLSGEFQALFWPFLWAVYHIRIISHYKAGNQLLGLQDLNNFPSFLSTVIAMNSPKVQYQRTRILLVCEQDEVGVWF